MRLRRPGSAQPQGWRALGMQPRPLELNHDVPASPQARTPVRQQLMLD
jgi:hypothetical protein